MEVRPHVAQIGASRLRIGIAWDSLLLVAGNLTSPTRLSGSRSFDRAMGVGVLSRRSRTDTSEHQFRVLLVGTGDVGTKVASLLAHDAGGARMRILGRDADRALRLANMARLSALQCGKVVDLDSAVADLSNKDATTQAIADYEPDLIFTSASVQAWHVITQLPHRAQARLAEAGYGPWLPMHLSPVLQLMESVGDAGSGATVVNSAFPDAVHPALRPLGLSPTAGIGNVANYIPGLRTLVASDIDTDIKNVDVRFMAHHFVSFSVSRSGKTNGAPYCLAIFLHGEEITQQFDAPTLFRRLAREQPRTSGKAGQLMTAASAVSILQPLIRGTSAFAHSPGFEGRIGGWPVAIEDRNINLNLPPSLTEQEIQKVNERGQTYDGIEYFDDRGVAHYSAKAAEIMSTEIGFTHSTLEPRNATAAAVELRRKFTEYYDRMWSLD